MGFNRLKVSSTCHRWNSSFGRYVRPKKRKLGLSTPNLSVLEVYDVEIHGAVIVRGNHLLAVAPEMDLRHSGLDRNLDCPRHASFNKFQFRIDSGTFNREDARVSVSAERALQCDLALGGTGIRYHNLPFGAAPVPILCIVPLSGPATCTHSCLQRGKGTVITTGLRRQAAF